MNHRQFKITTTQQDEIIRFDILYRLNSNPESDCHKLISKSVDLLSDSYQNLLNEGLILINEDSTYKLTELGKNTLLDYGKMFQKFKDLAIFKCVYPDGDEPDSGEPDTRFGTFSESANPPESEDYRIAIFENFSTRQKRVAPLHLIAFFSQIENQPLHTNGENWLFNLASGSYFSELSKIINSQLSAEAIAPEGWSNDEIIDVIYEAGMKELKRCFDEDQNKFSQNDIQDNEADFWIEETITETNNEADYEDYYHRDPYYYDPYWGFNAAVGSTLVVGAFAGLATCALLC